MNRVGRQQEKEELWTGKMLPLVTKMQLFRCYGELQFSSLKIPFSLILSLLIYKFVQFFAYKCMYLFTFGKESSQGSYILYRFQKHFSLQIRVYVTTQVQTNQKHANISSHFQLIFIKNKTYSSSMCKMMYININYSIGWMPTNQQLLEKLDVNLPQIFYGNPDILRRQMI